MPTPKPNTEVELGRFLSDNGVRVEGGQALRNPETGSPATPDFFIASVKLHIEVKGFMTLHAIKNVVYLAEKYPGYVLYQATDWHWREVLIGPAKEVLGEREACRIHEHAERVAAPHARRSRQTKSGGLYVKHERVYSVAFQREELLLMVRNEEIAKLASKLTLARLRAYALLVDEALWNMGLFGLDAPSRRSCPSTNWSSTGTSEAAGSDRAARARRTRSG